MIVTLKKTTDQLANFRGRFGDFVYNTDTDELLFCDGVTLGGVAVGGGVSDGDKGDITVGGTGTTLTIDPGAVTFAKMQAVSANVLLGNDAAGTTVEEIACTAAGRAILDDADAAAQRTTLGLVIGTHVQAWDTQLDSLAGLAYAGNANKHVRINAGESAFEVVTLAGGGDMLGANNLTDVVSAATAFGNIKQAASDAATGVIEIAIQSEMETGTDTTRAVVPGRQHFHPSSAKCWVSSTQSTTTIQQSYNVTSVGDTGAGISTVTIATDFAGTTYCVVVGAEHNSASGTTQTYNIDNSGRAAGTYVIQSWQVDGTEILVDPSASWFSVAYGDLA